MDYIKGIKINEIDLNINKDNRVIRELLINLYS